MSVSDTGDRSSHFPASLPLALALLLTAIGLWLRLHDITAQSLWWDEVTSWQQARLDLPGLIKATAADNYPPLHNLLLHFSMQLLGDTPFALRLPSALLGGLSILALYWAGSLIAGRPAALLAATLFCLSGFDIWYSQEARGYALMAFASIVYAGAALRFAIDARRNWGIATVLAGALLLYSHTYGALQWAALSLAILPVAWRRHSGATAMRILLVEAVALLLFLPWGIVLLGRAKIVDASAFWIPSVTPQHIYYYLLQLVTGRILFFALVLGGILAALPPLFRRQARVLAVLDGADLPMLGRGERLFLLALWGFLPLVLGIIASLLTEPVLYPRYLIGSLPALLLFACDGYARLPRNLLGALGLGLLGFCGFTGLVGSGPPDRDDFRDLSQFLTAQLRPGDCVVMTPESQIAMTYYDRQGFACSVVTPHVAAATFATPPPRIWVIENTHDRETDHPDVTALGHLDGENNFGDTRLLLVSPKPN